MPMYARVCYAFAKPSAPPDLLQDSTLEVHYIEDAIKCARSVHPEIITLVRAWILHVRMSVFLW